jgi:hypothetical protein
MLMTHPDVDGGVTCKALSATSTSCRTLLAMAGVSDSRAGEIAGRSCPAGT